MYEKKNYKKKIIKNVCKKNEFIGRFKNATFKF